MGEGLVLGVDQGSGSSKAVLLTTGGRVVKEFSARIHSTVSEGDRVEQDPEELFQSVRTLFDQALDFTREGRHFIVAAGLALQRSGVCAWDKETGKPLHPLITWADRTSGAELAAIGDTSLVTARSSLPVTPHYAGGKFARLQKKFPSPDVQVGTLDTFLMRRLTGKGFFTEHSMASRTMLYSLEAGGWDAELCGLFGVERGRLAEIRPSLAEHGTYRGVPVRALLGDQQASLFGRLNAAATPLLNMGTVTSLCIPLGSSLTVLPGFVSSVLCSRASADDELQCLYILEALTNASGNIIDLITNKLRLARDLRQIDLLCASAGDRGSDCIIFSPLGGSASPSWRFDLPEARLHEDPANPMQTVRALVENIGNFIVANILRLEGHGMLDSAARRLQVSGGLSELDFLVHHISDCSGYTIERMASREATARGAGIAAMLGAGMLEDPATLNDESADTVFEPAENSSARSRYERWCELRDEVETNPERFRR